MTTPRNRGLNKDLEGCLNIDGKKLSKFWKQGLVMRPWINFGYDCVTETPGKQIINTIMSSVREDVEWS